MLRYRRYWIFDMDGTLTLAKHDFEQMRRELGLPSGGPILETLAELPEQVASEKLHRLDEIERDIASIAEPQEGAAALLQRLAQLGVRMGILTRNTLDNALHTLEVCGLSHFFDSDDIVSRGCAAPKPSPEGIHKLLERWSGSSSEGVMIGDYLFDLQCGRSAGTATVYFDPRGEKLWTGHADLVVGSLGELSDLLE